MFSHKRMEERKRKPRHRPKPKPVDNTFEVFCDE